MWFWWALASAIFGAIDIILNKKALHAISAPVLTWSITAISLPFMAILAVIENKYTISWLFIFSAITSSILYVIGKTLMNNSLKRGLVSKLLPLSAFSGIFTYLSGLLFLNEHIALLPLLGLFVVIIGAYVLNVEQAKEGILKPFTLVLREKNSLYYLIAVFLVSLCPLFDKTAVINSTPVMTLLLENIVMFAVITPYVILSEKKWLASVRINWQILVVNGILFTIVSFLVFLSFSDGPIALVMGVKRLQIFFFLVMSIFLLKEKVPKSVWIASLIMVVGVLFIKIG